MNSLQLYQKLHPYLKVRVVWLEDPRMSLAYLYSMAAFWPKPEGSTVPEKKDDPESKLWDSSFPPPPGVSPEDGRKVRGKRRFPHLDAAARGILVWDPSPCTQQEMDDGLDRPTYTQFCTYYGLDEKDAGEEDSWAGNVRYKPATHIYEGGTTL